MARQPLTTREGRPTRPGGPYEGVPEHLDAQLRSWINDVFGFLPHAAATNENVMLCVATALRVPLSPGDRGLSWYHELMGWCEDDDERLLDIIHAAIQTVETPWVALDTMLTLGGSAWTATERGLQRRVAPSSYDSFLRAIRPEDNASDELSEAWANAFGRNPDASDAWDHAIKATEAMLIPAVVPKQAKATITHVIKAVETQGHLWRLGLPGPKNDYSVEPLVAMLRLLWPNPDRHSDPKNRRAPTLAEARAVVELAVTIVQWARDGQIVRR